MYWKKRDKHGYDAPGGICFSNCKANSDAKKDFKKTTYVYQDSMIRYIPGHYSHKCFGFYKMDTTY